MGCGPLEPLTPDASPDAAEDAGPEDTGEPEDAGAPGDAGIWVDAEVDAGSGRDAGMEEADAGIEMDAEPSDAPGSDGPPIDSGGPEAGIPDSGPPDSGLPDTGRPDSGVPDGGYFSCSMLSTSTVTSSTSTTSTSTPIFCQDFNAGTSTAWIPEGDSDWSVIGGEYVGSVTSTRTSSCGASLMMTSMFQPISARNVSVELDMRSIARADKIVVLRGLDGSNRIELNFRAQFVTPYPGDLVVQELRSCQQISHAPIFTILVPHQSGQTIHAEITLIADRLTVVVDGTTVLDTSYGLADRTGRIGVGVIEGGAAAFDNIVIRSLDQ